MRGADGKEQHIATFTESQFKRAAAEAGRAPTVYGHADDALYDDAVAHVRKTGRPSISGVQRALGIGYNRAACLLETMEERGVISHSDHRGDRKVL
ncbi:DNA translocase FtsK [Pseudoxanthomonas mexicana]